MNKIALRFAAALLIAVAIVYNRNYQETFGRSETSPPKEPNAANEQSAQPTEAEPPGSGFDFYVLALSWSPSYCQSKGASADPQQCNIQRPLAFVVHGLWPQNERGAPADCQAGEAQYIDRSVFETVKDIMPSLSLARHEWKKHGACSGLSQSQYFNTIVSAAASVVMPEMFRSAPSGRELAPSEVENAFIQANSKMTSKGFAPICKNGNLTEVRICLTKDLQFRECPQVDRNSCRQRTVHMPAAR